MNKTLKQLSAAALLLTMGACANYTLVAPGEQQAAPGLFVTNTVAWNKAPVKPGKQAALWTEDGIILDNLAFFGAVAPGQTLFNASKKDEAPTFRADMLPQEVAELYRASALKVSKSPSLDIAGLRPITFSGQPGFTFDYETVTKDEVVRKGRVAGAVIAGKLYLIAFEAPSLHYFESHIAEAERIIASAKVKG